MAKRANLWRLKSSVWYSPPTSTIALKSTIIAITQFDLKNISICTFKQTRLSAKSRQNVVLRLCCLMLLIKTVNQSLRILHITSTNSLYEKLRFSFNFDKLYFDRFLLTGPRALTEGFVINSKNRFHSSTKSFKIGETFNPYFLFTCSIFRRIKLSNIYVLVCDKQ